MKYRSKMLLLLFFLCIGIVGVAEAAPAITVIAHDVELAEVAERVIVIDNTVYVPLRNLAERLGAKVHWEAVDGAVRVTYDDRVIELWIGSTSAVVDGNPFMLEHVTFAKDERTYVPLRFLTQSLGMYVSWIDSTKTVRITSTMVEEMGAPRVAYTSEDKKWLAQIIEAEAGGEPLDGKIAVGAVIVNRVLANDFPDSITDVIFEYANGYYQFTPVQNKTIYTVTPSSETMAAVESALFGSDPTEGALFFYNPKKSASLWLASRKVSKDIGSHRFAF